MADGTRYTAHVNGIIRLVRPEHIEAVRKVGFEPTGEPSDLKIPSVDQINVWDLYRG